MIRPRSFALYLICLFALCPVQARADPPVGPGNVLNEHLETITDATQGKAAAAKQKSRDLIIVPIPQFNPSLGFGLTLAAGLFYNPNKAPEPWITGGGVMRTSNRSKAIAVAHKMSLADDRIRLVGGGGYADVNVNFYGVGPAAGDRNIRIKLNDRGYAGGLQGQMEVFSHIYLGPRFEYLDLKTRIERDKTIFPRAEIPTFDFNSTLSGIGFALAYDSRDSSLNPRKGLLVAGTAMFNATAIGSDFTHDKYMLSGNYYRPIGRSTTIAARASMCSVTKGGPFYDLCLYGMSNDLRGYEAGRYRNRAYWAAQAELRQHLFGRFGAVAFAGIGESADKVGDFGTGKWLPAAGGGLRYQPSKETPINIRVDYAWGRNSQALYVSVGEAF